MSGLRIRDAARVIVLDEHDRVLLTRFGLRDGGEVWTAVGGGLEPGETHELAARRELIEEAGLEVGELGPCVWTREHAIPDPVSFDVQRERFFLVRTVGFEPRPRLSWAELEAEGMTAIQWWAVDEIDASAGVRFAPRSLGRLLRELVAHGPPPEPMDAGE